MSYQGRLNRFICIFRQSRNIQTLISATVLCISSGKLKYCSDNKVVLYTLFRQQRLDFIFNFFRNFTAIVESFNLLNNYY